MKRRTKILMAITFLVLAGAVVFMTANPFAGGSTPGLCFVGYTNRADRTVVSQRAKFDDIASKEFRAWRNTNGLVALFVFTNTTTHSLRTGLLSALVQDQAGTGGDAVKFVPVFHEHEFEDARLLPGARLSFQVPLYLLPRRWRLRLHSAHDAESRLEQWETYAREEIRAVLARRQPAWRRFGGTPIPQDTFYSEWIEAPANLKEKGREP